MPDRIEKIKEYLAKSPSDSFLKHALALEYIKLSKDEQAEKLFSEIIKDNPDYVGTYYHYGKLLERKGEEKLAIEIYREGIRIAGKLNDHHTSLELQAAMNELEE
jgi:tetratricopeptide (TPR) repeat protein